MKRNINFNYVILFYDVNEKRVNKVFQITEFNLFSMLETNIFFPSSFNKQ